MNGGDGLPGHLLSWTISMKTELEQQISEIPLPPTPPPNPMIYSLLSSMKRYFSALFYKIYDSLQKRNFWNIVKMTYIPHTAHAFCVGST